MPPSPANSEVDDEEDVLPAKRPLVASTQEPAIATQRTGTTGGVIPDQDGDIPKPVQWSPDPTVRQGQVESEIARRRQAQFKQEHPFTPESWQPQINTRRSRGEDRQFAGQAEDQFRYQQQQERATAIAARRAQQEQQRNENDTREAEFRGRNQQMYVDAHGRIQPVIETETGRPLFHPTKPELTTHPKTGRPSIMTVDKYGQRQFTDPQPLPPLDPTSDQMEYRMPDGTTVAAGPIEDFAKSPIYKIAKVGLAAQKRKVNADHAAAIAPLKEMAQETNAALQDAKSERDRLTGVIDANQALMDNESDPAKKDALAATIAQDAAARDALHARVTGKGDLINEAARHRANLVGAMARQQVETYKAQGAEIAARVKAQGGKPENDPAYQENLRQINLNEATLQRAEGEFQRADAGRTLTPQAGAPGPMPQTTLEGHQAATNESLQQAEPSVAAKNGVTHVGGVTMKNFADRYGDGTGPVKPESLLKLNQRSKDIEATLTPDSAANLDPSTVKNLAEEKAYIDALFKQRFARLHPDLQKRVTDATRDPSAAEKFIHASGKAVGGLISGVAGAAKGAVGLALRQTTGGPDFINPDDNAATRALNRVQEFSGHLSDQAAPAEVEKKLNESFVGSTLPETAGGMASLFIPGGAVGRVAKSFGVGEAALTTLSRVATTATGSAQGANSMREQAIAALRPQLEAGKITQDEFTRSVGMAEVFGGATGAAMTAIGPMSKFSQRIAGLPAGRTFMASLLDRAGKGGTNAAVKWLAGEAGQKGISEMVREGLTMGGATFANDIANDLAAKAIFDSKRKIDASKAGESAGQMALVTALTAGVLRALPKSKGGAEPSPGGEPKPTLTPDQQAAEAEFQKALAEPTEAKAEPVAPAEKPKPSTAAEAAQVFEPALKEKENTPPPAKSAQESAKYIADIQDTTEASTKVAAQQEAKAQKLVDQIQEATGKSREDILATRKGREAGEWSKELETEAKYQKSPLMVDPERRITELKSEIKKLDEDWAKHVMKTSAEAEIASQIQGDKDKASAQFQITKNRHDTLMERRNAIEDELAKAEALRKSPQGAEGLKGELSAEQVKAESDSRKLRTPDLEERRNAIEQQLNEADRVRQSNKGGADLAKDLAKKEGREPPPPPEEPGGAPAEKTPTKPTAPAGSISDEVHGLNGQQLTDKYQKRVKGEQGLTEDALSLGDATKTPEGITQLAERRDAARAQYEAAKKSDASPQERMGLALKEQFFSEAHQQATKSRTFVTKPETPVGTNDLLKDENFDKEWTAQGARAGSENQVVMKDGRVYKRNYSSKLGQATPMHGSIEKFRDHIALRQEIFPESDVKIEGMSQTSDGPAPVTSEKQVSGKAPSTKELREFMAKKGFEPAGGNNFINREAGIRVNDLSDTNVVKAEDGHIYVTDPVIERIKSNAIQVPKSGEVSLRQASENREGVRGENAVNKGAAAAREVKQGGGRGEPVLREAGNDVGRGYVGEKAKDENPPAVREEVVHEIKLPKDAAPVSAHVESHTAETVEGDRINKNWTAFDKNSGTLGVPRAEMPQIKSEHRGALVNFLRARDIPAKAVMIRPGDLKPTQAEFSPEKVQKAREFSGSERPILISADGHVVDGHHQWMAGLQDDPQAPMPAIKLNAPIDKLIAEMKEFPSTESAKGVAAKAATRESSISAPATKRLSDRAIDALQKAIEKNKEETKKFVGSELGVAYQHAERAALELAVLGVRAGRAVADVIKLALQRFKAMHPQHTQEELAKAEETVRSAMEQQNQSKESAPTTGIAHRVSEARGAKAERGEGISAKDSVEHGRDLIKKGFDPEKALDDFNKTKTISADAMAGVRAHGEELSKAANKAADEHGVDSPQYKAAWAADKAWIEKVKPMQTEWHKIGQAQQGETEVDTGTFHGLSKAFFQSTGKEFTPKQATDAKRIADNVKGTTEAADVAKDKVLKEVGLPNKTTEASVKAAKNVIKTVKAGAEWSPIQAKALWHVAKAEYLDKGITDFNDIRAGLAIDYGLSKADIATGLASPKGVRPLTDAMYAKMAERRRVINQAKQWLASAKYPKWEQFMRGVPNAFFNIATFGHGTVGTVTHAGSQIFNPSVTKDWITNFGRGFKLMGLHDKGAYHEQMTQDLVRDPNFIKAKRAGLANDPFRYQDDYQNPGVVKMFKGLGLAGNRGFDNLKFLRQDMFNKRWDGLPDGLKTGDMAKLIADSINHATGIIRAGNFPKWTNTAFFAPKLEASRWAFLYGDPAKAAKTFVGWKGATPEAKNAALSEVKQKAAIAGTYLGALAINQAMLAATGSSQKINFADPRHGDWLSFKGFGHNFGVVGPMISSVRFLQNIAHDFWGERTKLEQLQASRGSAAGERAFEYARGKLSPFAKVGLDVASQSDAVDRPMPWNKEPLSYRAKRAGYTTKYGYGEYASQNLLPIPFEEAAREVWKSQGVDDATINDWMRAIAVGAISGTTGARISEDKGPPKPAARAKPHAVKH